MTKAVRFWRDPQGLEYMSADVKGSRFVYTSWYVWTLFGWEPIEVPSEEARHTFADDARADVLMAATREARDVLAALRVV